MVPARRLIWTARIDVQPDIPAERPTTSVRDRLLTSDLNIYRSASLLIDLHGQGAIIDTTVRVDAPRVAGDLDVHAVWLRVRAAMLNLLKPSV